MDTDNTSALVFPGQGAQKSGMAKDFYAEHEVCRSVFEKASNAIGVDLCQICFTETPLLNSTEYTQPAILTCEIAIVKVLQSVFGLKSNYFAGHSLGEYTALVAADVISLEDAVKIVRKRGELMQTAPMKCIGAMSALISDSLPSKHLQQLCEDLSCDIANHNSNSQIVISGSQDCVHQVTKKLEEDFPQISVVPLKVSTAFHSRYMQPVEEKFFSFLQQYVGNFDISRASNVLSNYTGKFHSAHTLVSSLVKQISMPVQWIQNMQNLTEVTKQIYEVGPQRVLGKFFSTHGVNVPSIVDLRSLYKAMKGAHCCEV